MRRYLLIAALAFSALFGMGVLRAGTPQPADIAGQFVVYLLADNYDAAYALFDPALQQTIPQTRLLSLWNDVRFYGGEASRVGGVKVNGNTVIVVVEFERLAYEVEVSVDAEGEIYRLFFTAVPLPPSVEGEMPLEGEVTPAAPIELPPNPAEAALLTLVAPTVEPATGAQPTATITAIVPTAIPATPTIAPTLPSDPRGAAAIRLAQALGANDYDAAVALFHPDLVAALSVERLEAAWTRITAGRGEFVDVQSYRIDAQSRTVVVRAELARGVVDLLISIDADGRIFSLYFV